MLQKESNTNVIHGHPFLSEELCMCMQKSITDSYHNNTHTSYTGVSSLGVPGVPWHTQILADQLTLSQLVRGADYAHLITTGTPGFLDLPTALIYMIGSLKWLSKYFGMFKSCFSHF